MKIVRNGDRETIQITVAELGGDESTASTTAAAAPRQLSRLGLEVEGLAPETIEQLGISGGVTVVQVDPQGAAREAGIRPGDIITRLNNKETSSPAALTSVAEALPAGRSVPVLILRNGSAMFLPLRVRD